MNKVNITEQENSKVAVSEYSQENVEKDIGNQEEQEIKKLREQYRFFGIGSIIYAFIYVLLLYKNPISVTYPVFIGITLSFCVAALNKFGIKLKKISYFLIAAIMLCSISVCLTTNYAIIAFDKVAVFLLLLFLMMEQLYDTEKWSVGRNLLRLILRMLGMLEYCIKPWSHLFHFISSLRKKKSKNRIYIFTGILIAIPLTTVIMTLLAQADTVFFSLFERVINLVSISPDTIGIIFSILFCYGIFYSFICSSMVKKEDANYHMQKVKAVTAITFTSIIAFIYLIFCILQISYLFTGYPDGISYSQFAREGFFELLFVSSINLIMIIICVELFEKSRVLNIILIVISGCTYILIGSSVYRMMLYIEVHNLTFLRIFVLWFLAVLTIWMTGAIVYIIKRKWNYFKFSVSAITIMYLIFVYISPDRIIAKYNIMNDKTMEASDIFYLYDNLSHGDVLQELLKIEKDQIEANGDEVIKNLEVYSNDIIKYCEETPVREMNLSYRKSYQAAKKYLNIN